MSAPPNATRRRGRPAPQAPAGRVTLAEAATELGLTYDGIYKYLRKIPHRRDDGTITLTRGAVDRVRGMLRAAPEYPDGRRAIQVRPTLERYEKWALAAARNGNASVALWLAELADDACRAEVTRG